MKVVAKVPDSQVMAELDAAVAWAKKVGKGDTPKLGVTGFCWGGRIVWLSAVHNNELKAGVAWDGRPTGKANDLQPKFPLQLVKHLKAPVLGQYEETDTVLPVAGVEAKHAAVKKADKTAEIVLFEYAPMRSSPTTARATRRTLPGTGGRSCSPGPRSAA